LVARGFTVLRFDFTGLGGSDGDFANTNFSFNIQDLIAAANFMRESYQAPVLLIGHSLGGTAVLNAAAKVEEFNGVATIGAPADAAHVARQFSCNLGEIEAKGEAQVRLAGRPFTIKKTVHR
jgi:alpha/beta superfamily hydrolase